jgi:hypothetical protein
MFWGATAASVFLLGSVWSTATRLRSPRGNAVDAVVLVLAGLALSASLFAAGRIAFIVGRVKKRPLERATGSRK